MPKSVANSDHSECLRLRDQQINKYTGKSSLLKLSHQSNYTHRPVILDSRLKTGVSGADCECAVLMHLDQN